MRIGEIAAMVGMTTRAIRHYHHLGLLPEPVRRANGYRDYTLRDAVLLARIRRLTELGLGLDEVRDVVADDEGRELVDVLEELDADLGRQEALVKSRRARLAVLLEQARAGRLPAEGPVSPRLAEVFREMAGGPADASPMAAKDREVLALLDTVASDAERDRMMEALHTMARSPGAVERAHEVYGMLDALVDADPADPAVETAARGLAELIPDAAVAHLGPEAGGAGSEGRFLDVFLADFAPAQGAAVARALRIVMERAR
ncbi:MerR family transcriptional regulator [Streptomyces purpureus]|nr:MerR family transcriptional regulator [Streptomyces purpureus]